MLAQPCVSEYCRVSAEFRNCEDSPFGVFIVSKDDFGDFTDHSCLVRYTIDVEDRDRLDELSRRDFVLLNVVLVDEETGRAAIDKRGGAMLDT